MAENDLAERVAKLEVSQEYIAKGQDTIIKHLEGQTETMRGMKKEISKLDVQIVKTKSFVGGMAFSFSILGGIIVTGAKYGLAKIGINVI
jgi:hypothetical protein